MRELHSSRGSREGNNAFLEVRIILFLPRFHLAIIRVQIKVDLDFTLSL